MERDLEDIVKECREFIELKKKEKSYRHNEQGSPAYLVSKQWLTKYKKYILWSEVRANRKPQIQGDHCSTNYPGQMTNVEDLCENTDTFLKGTGSQDFDSAVFDTYIKMNVRERHEYKLYGQELWQFLHGKYGGSVIKRFYQKEGSYYTQVDVRYKISDCVILPCSKLYSGEANEESIKEQKIQLSKKKSYLELKKRVVDILQAQNFANIEIERVRLWKYHGDKEEFINVCKKVSIKSQDLEERKESSDPDLEINSGVEFPGDSLEPILNAITTFGDDTLDECVLVIEVADLNSPFAFMFRKNQRIIVGKCEFCQNKKQLKVECACKKVRYCSDHCLSRDKQWHQDKCATQVDGDLKTISFVKNPNAKNGKVGLSNLGNTCFMNSSLQCLSNTWELTKYFLDLRFQGDINITNAMGTEGRLATAYAKLMNEMWNEPDQVVRPTMFKKVLGNYAVQFSGYQQHDSQECINTILDLLSEDLYRRQKKPYIESVEVEGKPDIEASIEAWDKHIIRNDSIIVDLFHGQYKSTLICQICQRISITFDPFMTLSLPIPGKREKLTFFFIKYDLSDTSYSNQKGEVYVRDSDIIQVLRQQIAQKFEINPQSFVITHTQDNNFKRVFNQSSKIEEMRIQGGEILIYEIDPSLNPNNEVPLIDRIDNNYGIHEDYNMQALYMCQYVKSQYSYSYSSMGSTPKAFTLPRLFWVNKNWTMKKVHLEVFKFIKGAIYKWFDSNDKKPQIKKISIDEKDTDDIYSLEEFKRLTDEEQFQACFPILTEESWETELKKVDFNPSQLIYALRFKDISGYNLDCPFCNDRRCSGCPVPFSDKIKYGEFLEKLQIKANESYFTENTYKGRKEITFELVWSKFIESTIFSHFTGAKAHKSVSESKEEKKEGEISLKDCLEEFSNPELLDEENKWYCTKCKDHVQATKKLEIYRPPSILVVSLKRFKGGKKSMYGYGNSSMGSKLSTLVDFPLSGLDMAPFILSQNDHEPLIYDLFGVSNHFGSVGFGHYTAYAKNWQDQQWYNFDDSNCSKTSESRIVSDSAYNLFYRRRDYVNLEQINFDKLRQTVDPAIEEKILTKH